MFSPANSKISNADTPPCSPPAPSLHITSWKTSILLVRMICTSILGVWPIRSKLGMGILSSELMKIVGILLSFKGILGTSLTKKRILLPNRPNLPSRRRTAKGRRRSKCGNWRLLSRRRGYLMSSTKIIWKRREESEQRRLFDFIFQSILFVANESKHIIPIKLWYFYENAW